jgi:hypothetical protein
MFLAQTVFQQQEGTLMAIENWLIVSALGLGVLLIILGAVLEAKLGRANRIALATHDLMKALLEETKKANVMLQYLNDRAYDAVAKKPGTAETADATTRKAEPDVYKL